MQTVDARGTGEQLLAGGEGAGHVNPLVVVHRLLRGRYALAAVLGLGLAAPLAWLGYQSRQPMFTSQGVVVISPTQRQILFQTQDNQAIPFFEQYVNAQAAHLSNQRALAAAIDNPALRLTEVGWPAGTAGVAALDRATSTRIPPRSGMILLTVSHESAEAARVACQGVLDVYREQFVDRANNEWTTTIGVLEGRASSRRTAVEGTRARIRDVAELYGTTDLQPMIDNLNREVTDLDIQIGQLKAEIDARASAAQGSEGSAEGQEARPSAADLSPEDLAAHDEELRNLLRRRDQLLAEIEAYSVQFSPRHMEVQTRQGTLATVQRLITLRAEVVRAGWTASGPSSGASLSELRLRLERAEGQRAALFKRVRELATALTSVQQLEAQVARLEGERLEAERRLDQLRTERGDQDLGRVTIQDASVPLSASSDKRMMMAAAGGVGGMGLGVGIVLLMGLARGGFRFIDEFDGTSGSLLIGVVPDLGSRREPTPEAALCIHHARALLDRRVPPKRERGRIIAVTSPTAGDGKTTVCCSLATSFAMAGFRTVVIDADFVGRGMTSRLEMDRAPGLSDALSGMALEEALSPGGAENLTILSAGREEALGADRLSASNLGPMLERLARAHDVVLVDSGPVLGSIEATVTVGLADAVLAVVSRGQSVKMFAAMRRKLRSLGSDLCGVIFNRAYPKDFAHSTHTSVVSAQSQRSRSVQVPDFVTMGRNGMARSLPGVGAGADRGVAAGTQESGGGSV